MYPLTENGHPHVNMLGNTNPNNGAMNMSDKKNTDSLPEWIDTRQASEIMGVEQDTVAEHCRNKTINCMKIGTSWAVSRVDAENFERSNRGRKPKTN